MRPGCSPFLAALVVGLLALPATAATITVNSPLDTSGNGAICTLRDAITAANNNAPAGGCAAGSPHPALDTINIPQSRTSCLLGGCVIILGSPLPTVVEDVSIVGSGNWTPVLNGNNTYRHFDLGGVVVNLTNLTLINGRAAGAADAGYGGAIRTSNLDTTLTVNRLTFSSNFATSRGGALYVAGGTVTVNDSTFVNNTTDTYGGAIGQVGGLLIVNRSTLTGNTALDGGGLEIQGSSETRLTNVTFSGNTARGKGGAISRIGITYIVSLNNVTITGNTADSDSDGNGDGGGLYRGGGTVTMSNSILAGNGDSPHGVGTRHPDCSWPASGALTSNGYNLLGIDAGCAGLTDTVNGDRVGTAASPLDARFGPLASNGGYTQTRALLADSPALDAGSPLTPGGGSFAPCAATDQRNIARPIGAACDMGAYEAPLDDEDRDGVVNSSDNCIFEANGPILPDAGGGSQRDADADGYGNRCDPDLNNTGTVTAADYSILRSVLNQSAGASATAAAADLNGSGTVTAADYAILRSWIGTPPGPSGVNCTPGVDECGWDVVDVVTRRQLDWNDLNDWYDAYAAAYAPHSALWKLASPVLLASR